MVNALLPIALTKGAMQEMLLDIFITHDIEEANFLSERIYVGSAWQDQIQSNSPFISISNILMSNAWF